jgi:hypothetical protein
MRKRIIRSKINIRRRALRRQALEALTLEYIKHIIRLSKCKMSRKMIIQDIYQNEYLIKLFGKKPAHRTSVAIVVNSCIKNSKEKTLTNIQKKIKYIPPTSECRTRFTDFKSAGCYLCAESARCCMHAHHINPKEKRFNVGGRKLL